MTSTPASPASAEPRTSAEVAASGATTGAAPRATSGMDARNIESRGMEIHLHRFVAWLARRGVSIMGSRLLAVRGRTSGEWRTNPVNLLTYDGARYLVAPRGHTQWVRNIRVAGGGELRLGRKAESFTATELSDADKIPVLRRYLERWGWEVGQFFEGVTKDASDEELAAIAPGFPAFRIN